MSQPADPSFVDPALIESIIHPVIDDDARDRVTVAGPDAMTYLQSQIAQGILDLDVGASRWTLVLEPTGKIGVLARIMRTADDVFVLDTDAGFGAALLERINRFRIRVQAETTLTEADRTGPSDQHESRRIAAGWPRMGAEIVPGETIPATTGVVPYTVDFKKGCYPGQELVERMDSRGADAPRMLRILDVPAGTEVGDTIDDVEVTSVDGSTALGYVKRGADIGRIPTHLA